MVALWSVYRKVYSKIYGINRPFLAAGKDQKCIKNMDNRAKNSKFGEQTCFSIVQMIDAEKTFSADFPRFLAKTHFLRAL